LLGNFTSFAVGLMLVLLADATQSRPSYEVPIAHTQVERLETIVTEHYERTKGIPRTWDEMLGPIAKGTDLENVTEPLEDPWGTVYRILGEAGPQSIEVVSAGPDRKSDTEDDISSRGPRNP
jgi:hypothetical protein